MIEIFWRDQPRTSASFDGIEDCKSGACVTGCHDGFALARGLVPAHFRSIFQISLLHPSTQHGVGELSRPADPSRELLPGSGLAEVAAGAL